VLARSPRSRTATPPAQAPAASSPGPTRWRIPPSSIWQGQTKVESFTITSTNGNGGLITKQIDVTITGTNDAPVITARI